MRKFLLFILAAGWITCAQAQVAIPSGPVTIFSPPGGSGTGAISSVTGGNGIVANPTTGAVIVSTTNTLNQQVGTSYATASTDGGKLVTLNNASPVAVSLVQANTAGFTSGFEVEYQDLGAGTVTITPATSTINGAATVTLAQYDDVLVWSDGTNYFAIKVPATLTGVSSITGTANQITASASTGAVTLSIPAVAQIATSLALGGCTISTDVFCGTGTATISATLKDGANVEITNNSGSFSLRTTGTPLTSPANATLQFGQVDNASPVAQITQVQGVVTGTANGTPGVIWKFRDSAGVGTGASGGYEWDTHPAGGSSTVPNAAVSEMTLSTAGVLALPSATTGTNADFWCAGAGGTFLIQSSACTISDPDRKSDKHVFTASLIPAMMKLETWTFTLKDGAKNPDPNARGYQLGLMATDVARLFPLCAVYYNTKEHPFAEKKPSSYRQECVIAALVKVAQEQQTEIVALQNKVH